MIFRDFVSQTTVKMEIYSFLWFAACLAANIYHIYNLIYEYSKYEVSTDVQYIYPDVINVPMTLFCLPVWRTIKFFEISKEELAQLLRREPDEYTNETSWIPYDFDNDTYDEREAVTQKMRVSSCSVFNELCVCLWSVIFFEEKSNTNTKSIENGTA